MNFQSGFVAVIGRPNVGKSTLINELSAPPISRFVLARGAYTRDQEYAIKNNDRGATI